MYYLISHTYLYTGTGMPCAGQRSDKFFPFCFSKMNPFDSVENVGGLVPTGSIENAT